MSPERVATNRELDWHAMLETAMTMPGNLGNTFNRWYEYSFANQVLLMMQGVREPVATYKRWQEIGRQVLKGSKAKEIIRPIFIDIKNDQGEVEGRITRFKPVKCLFTYSETAGDELPPVEVPHWDLDTALDKLDIKRVPFELLESNTQGYSFDRNIAISPVAAYPLKTTFHEVGHIVLGHTAKDKMLDYMTHRGVMEFEAEASAYLVANELEVQTEEEASVSRGYIQHWLKDERPANRHIRNVFSCVDTVLKAGRVAIEVEQPSLFENSELLNGSSDV